MPDSKKVWTKPELIRFANSDEVREHFKGRVTLALEEFLARSDALKEKAKERSERLRRRA